MDNHAAANAATSRLRNLLASGLPQSKRALYEVQLQQLCRRYALTFGPEVLVNLTDRAGSRTKIYVDQDGCSYTTGSSAVRRLDRGEAGRMIADHVANGGRAQFPTLIG